MPQCLFGTLSEIAPAFHAVRACVLSPHYSAVGNCELVELFISHDAQMSAITILGWTRKPGVV